MSRWNENLWPPSGFEFFDSDNIRHTGSGLHDLISKLAAYRTRRGLPPGNPMSEVNEQLCAKYPSRCLNEPPPPAAVAVQSPAQPMAARLTAWLRATYLRVAGKAVAYVSEEEVVRRAAICLKCPLHTSFPGGCVACAETINQISFQLRAGRDRRSSLLRVCGKYGTDLRVDALLDQPTAPDAPEGCWKK
jgi:hypothetical protein